MKKLQGGQTAAEYLSIDLIHALAMKGTLRLVEYDPIWPSQFAAKASRLREALVTHIVAIEHIGSTAIPGMLSKPVLDVAISVADVVSADACILPMQRLGYRYRGMNGDDDRRRYYVCDVAGRRVTQVHLYILPAVAWDDQLRFRDALRSSATLASAYAAEKRRAAEITGWDKSAYSNEKAQFIRAVLDRLSVGCTMPVSSHDA